MSANERRRLILFKSIFLALNFKMDKEELIADSKTIEPTGFNVFIILRYLLLTGILALGLKILIKKAFEIRQKVQLIDKIPGPKSFNFLLGNIPLEIIKYVGADYEASKGKKLVHSSFEKSY